MSNLQKTLESGNFAITAELAPPKGCDFSHQLECAELLKECVTAVNVTDFQSSSLKASSLGMVIKLKEMGVEPILQMTGRDRSRMAIQGDILAAAAFGVENVLALTGDHTKVGDDPNSKPVFDLDSVGILQACKALSEGHDMGGNALSGEAPKLYTGAIVTPEYDPLELQLIKLKKKVASGAKYIQTQGIYDLEHFKAFMQEVKRLGINAHIMAGIIPLKNAGMAKYMNKNVPGINVPDSMIQRLNEVGKENAAKEGIKIAAELVKQIKEERICDGVHIMAIGAEENVPVILKEAGL